MTTSWIEKNLSNNPFIYIENGEYSFKDFFELLIEYYNFSSEIINKNEKITFISKSVLQYSIFSNLIPMLGGIFVPMNPKSPIDEITKKMNIIGSKKIIYDESIELEKVDNISLFRSEKSQESNYRFTWPSYEETFCILFTSGSSGLPKAVSISRKNIESSCNISQKNLNVEKSDKWLLCMPPYHAGGLSIIYRSLILGNKFHIEDDFNSEKVIDLIMSEKINIVSMVPTMLSKIVYQMKDRNLIAPKSFKFVLSGGAKTPEELILSSNNIGLKTLPTYGMTETSSQIATASPNDEFRPLNSVGKPLLRDSVKIAKNSEIQVSGEMVANYYDEKVSKKWLQTGDYGYIDKDNYLFVKGRIDELIISGGENINPLEVEEFISKNKKIKECIVLGKTDEYWGEKVVAAIYSDDDITLEEINSYLGGLDKFKYPKDIVQLKKPLPKLHNGKFDRKKIKKLIDESK
jgi:O-succinylbenzoic acid--CoA ligase|tara:strand:- start:4074 stop:5459 length:1386 start_codon:yes stop_codon:yes gene_type:complete